MNTDSSSFKSIFENAVMGLYRSTLDGRILMANPALVHMLGYASFEELARLNIEMNGYADGYSRSDFKRRIESEGQVIGLESAWKRRDGSTLFVRENARAVRDPAGHLLYYEGTVEDITERKQVEEKLRASEIRYRMLFENANDAIFMMQDDHFVDCNPKTLEMFGCAREQILNQSPDRFSPPLQPDGRGSRDKSLEKITLALGGQPQRFDWRHIRYDGSPFDAEVSLNRIELDGQVFVQAVVRDITDRVRAEQEALRLQHLLKNITDSMPSALITLDAEGRALTWNPAAEALIGCAAQGAREQPVWLACSAMARYRDLFEQVLRERQIQHRHREPLATETGTVYRDVSAFPLASNAIEGVVLRIDDVTRRVQLEEMMLQASKMASVGGLAAGVAHEINNPLGAMMQSAQMLQMAFDLGRPRTRERLQALGLDPEKLAQYLQERKALYYLEGIHSAGARAAKIVSDLLSFSRKTTSDAIPHDMNALVEQTLDLAATDYDLKKKYDFREIEIVRELAPNLPQVRCDGQQIQQVVLNLVRNAAQAMAQAKSAAGAEYKPRLSVRTMPQGSRVRLEVEDNGPGIPEAARTRLFEPFYTTKPVGEGTGLGLWLCWSIVVERHQGQLLVEPAPGGGARFIIELPAAP